MNSTWSNKWKACLIWFSAYISFTAFALVGGYTMVKGDNDELKAVTKKAFIVTLIFAAVSAFLTLFYNFASMSDNYYLSAAYDFYTIATKLVAVAEIVVYAVFILLTFVKKDAPAAAAQSEDDQAA